MSKITVGDSAPDSTFESTDPSLHSFNDLLGQKVVIYFYPKDSTPGCTKEGRDFSALNSEFAAANTRIVGVSRDSMNKHQKFCQSLALPFPLISDPDEELCRYFDVMIKDNFILKFLLGIERTTFLLDEKGKIRKIWRKVKVKGHAQAVLKAVQELNG